VSTGVAVKSDAHGYVDIVDTRSVSSGISRNRYDVDEILSYRL
jgi:hypothetical protein